MVKKSQVFMYWCILLYFAILFFERAQSLFFSLLDKNFYILNSYFDIYSYGMVCVSLLASLILMLTINLPFFKALVSRKEEIHKRVSAIKISITIGMLLISGMIHTDNTIIWLQFIAYGFLIVAMLSAGFGGIKSNEIENINSVDKKWISLLYLIAYSMAIPVVYESHIPNALTFHIVEAAGSIILIGVFSFMLYKVLAGKASNLLYVAPIHMLMFIDVAILWMRWDEEINYFLLVSLGITVVLWLIGTFVRLKKE